MQAFDWYCPFCNHYATLTEQSVRNGSNNFLLDNAHGKRQLAHCFIVCPNPKCKQFTLAVQLFALLAAGSNGWVPGKPLGTWQLIPPSEAKVFPSYVPQAILADYKEACLIRDLSPKSSATLARRCLQGMIRDFWGIKKKRLAEAINTLKSKVEPLTWKAIDAVRSVGNIGAHMEKDINLLIDVEPQEASALIKLIEMLIQEWYINRHEREEQLKAVVAVADDKKQAKKQPVT